MRDSQVKSIPLKRSFGMRCVGWCVVTALPMLLALGCGARKRTSVYPPTGHIDPKVNVGKLPSAPATSKRTTLAPWYYTLITGKKSSKPSSKPVADPEKGEVVEIIDLDDPAAVEAYWNPSPKAGDQAPKLGGEPPAALLTEILNGVLAGRSEASKWSLLRLELIMKVPKRPATMMVSAQLILKNLYLRRPLISFDRVRLEECMTRLAQQAGMRHAQDRAHNPVISWRKENVSVIEAVDTILGKYGFERRFSGASARVRLKVRKYPDRSEFVKAAIDEILAAGRGMDRDVATLVVTPKVKRASRKKDEGDRKEAPTAEEKKDDTKQAEGSRR